MGVNEPTATGNATPADNIPLGGVVIPFNYRFERAEDIHPTATIHYLKENEDPWETLENRFPSRDQKPLPPTPEELKQQRRIKEEEKRLRKSGRRRSRSTGTL